MNKLFLLLFVFCASLFGSEYVKAQSTNIQPVRIDAYPPSPTAASLGKFADIPIGLNNGTPSINIPIWTVKEGDIELPITLSYHAGGIQVAEMASWVGLGWALQAGGVITRSVRGLADDLPYGFLDKAYNPMPTASDNATQLNDKYLYYTQGFRDSQPDAFSFNFSGKTGKFQMDQEGAMYIVPFQKINIVPTWSNLSIGRVISSWMVTTDDGFKYEFNNREVSRTLTSINGGYSSPLENWYVSSWYLSKITSPTGDILTFEYETPYSVSPFAISVYDNIYMFLGTINGLTGGSPPPNARGVVYTEINEAVRLKSINFTGGKISFSALSSRCDLPGEKLLDEIVVNEGATPLRRFKLLYSGNTCPGAPSPTTYRPMLVSVQETDGSGTISKPAHSFTYFSSLPDRLSCSVDDWGYHNGKTNDVMVPALSYNGNMLAGANKEVDFASTCNASLYKITYPTGGTTTFDYELNDADRGYYKFTTKSFTLKGEDGSGGSGSGKLTGQKSETFMINNANAGAATTPVTLNVSNCPCLASTYTRPCSTFLKLYRYNGPLIWSSESLTKPLASSYVTLQLPSGTYQLFLMSNQYPTETYYPQLEMNVSIRESVQGFNIGGLRIKKMEDFDPVASKKITKFYSYTDTLGNSSGRILRAPKYGYEFRQDWMASFPSGNQYGTNIYYVRTSSPNVPMAGLNTGSHISYGRVTVDHDELNTVYSPQYPMPVNIKGVYGRSVHKFTTLETALQNDPSPTPEGFPFSPGNTIDWMSGDPLETIDYSYDSEARTWWPVKQVRHYYSFYGEGSNTNVKSFRGLKVGLAWRGLNTNTNGYIPLYFKIATQYKHLVKTTEVSFDPKDVTKKYYKETRYEYGVDHLQQTKSSSTTSDGKLLTSYTTYPTDYTDNTGFINSLKLANILNVPIEKVTYKSDPDGTGNVKILSGEINTYQDNQKGLLDEVFTLDVANPVPLADFRFSNRSTANVLPPAGTASAFYRHPNSYTSRLKYNAYDAKSNVVQYTRDGFVTSLLWGHNSTLPIAKALNATSSGNVADASQIAYNGYELGTQTGESGWEEVAVGNIVSRATDPTNVCAGKYAYRMAVPAAGYTSYSSTLNLYPSPQKGRYKMGCWVKTAPGFVEGLATIEMYAIKKGTAYAKYPVNAINAARFVIPNTNDKWKYFEVVLDFDAVKALVPTEELSIRCYTASRSTTPVYIDEVRICPIDAQMTTLTHELMVGPSSIVNPDNSAELYEYDGLGRLKLVKDPVGNILRSHTYKYKGQ